MEVVLRLVRRVAPDLSSWAGSAGLFRPSCTGRPGTEGFYKRHSPLFAIIAGFFAGVVPLIPLPPVNQIAGPKPSRPDFRSTRHE